MLASLCRIRTRLPGRTWRYLMPSCCSPHGRSSRLALRLTAWLTLRLDSVSTCRTAACHQVICIFIYFFIDHDSPDPFSRLVFNALSLFFVLLFRFWP